MAQGQSSDQIANDLSVGRQALAFYLHHTRNQNRGVDWNRSVMRDGRPVWETSLLVQLHSQGLTHQEIADRLNQIFQTTLPTDPEIRTQASISKKLQELGLSEPVAHDQDDLYHPDYGQLKSHGRLNPLLVTRFIFDHYQKDDAWLSDQLGITKARLQEFYQRHHIIRQGGKLNFERGPKTQALLARYERQRQAIQMVLNWMKANDGKIPTARDYGAGPGKVGVIGTRLFGAGDYRIGGENETSRIFDSPEAAYTALAEAAKAQGTPFRFIDVQWYGGIPEKLRPVIQSEAIAMILNWIKAHDGKVPTQYDYGTAPGKVGIADGSLFGTGSYRPGGKYENSRIFDSPEAAYAALAEAAKAQGIPFRLIDVTWSGGIPEKLRPLIQSEAITMILIG